MHMILYSWCLLARIVFAVVIVVPEVSSLGITAKTKKITPYSTPGATLHILGITYYANSDTASIIDFGENSRLNLVFQVVNLYQVGILEMWRFD